MNKDKMNSENNTPELTDMQIAALKRKKKRRLSRRFKHGGYATVMIVAVLAVVIILNVVLSVLGNIYGLSIDLTTAQTYGLSDEVKPYVRDNDKDITIYMLAKEVDLTGLTQLVQLNSMLKEFAGLNDRITLEYVDLVNNPTFVSNYPDLTLSAYNLLFDCNGHTRVLTLTDLFPTETDQSTGTVSYKSNVEQKLLSAMIIVSADSHAKIGFLGGHDETTPSALIDLLEENGYEIFKNEQLAIGLTEDFDALVICAPTRDYSEEELKALDTYLNNGDKLGKNVFYFADLAQPELPNLEAFLSEWGALIGSGVSVESDSNKVYYQSPYCPIASYVDAEDKYSSIFAERNVNLVAPNSRQLSLAFSEDRNRTALVLLTLSETSYVIDDVTNPNTYDNATVKGSIPVAVVGDRAMYDADGNYMRSDVFTIASTAMLDASFLSNSSVLNGDYVINLFNRTLNTYDLVYIAPRSIDTQQINITSGQANTIAVIFAVVLPLAVLCCGFGVYLRRRHL